MTLPDGSRILFARNSRPCLVAENSSEVFGDQLTLRNATLSPMTSKCSCGESLKDVVDVGRGKVRGTIEPPEQQFGECAGDVTSSSFDSPGMLLSRQGGNILPDASEQALFKMFSERNTTFVPDERSPEGAAFICVVEERPDEREWFAAVVSERGEAIEPLSIPLAEQQFFEITEMDVKSGATNTGAFNDIADRDRVITAFKNQRDERVAEKLMCPPHATIFEIWSLRGHNLGEILESRRMESRIVLSSLERLRGIASCWTACPRTNAMSKI
jgi:hypothetical protein